jgi:hypothetical protein
MIDHKINAIPQAKLGGWRFCAILCARHPNKVPGTQTILNFASCASPFLS